ncbi:MAG: NAD-dependent DNA ligase LigA [Simkaniaceae bacterium]|nr:NAD-dependent DNA ligase LigA [Simkaniaceae bacterium]
MTYEDYIQLIETIRHHDMLYYIENRPRISDYEYDMLYKDLEAMEQEHPDWTLASSPTQTISDSSHSGFKQKSHAAPMLSLANTYSEEELADFIKRTKKLLERYEPIFFVEYKMDGLAISLRYEKGVLVCGLTRGGGKKGDDITQNVKAIKNLPFRLKGKNIPDVLEVRAEVFMPVKVFEELNAKRKAVAEELWANPRNAAAGSLKLLDVREVYKRKLDLIAFGIIEDSSHGVDFQKDVAHYLKNLGFPTFAHDQMAIAKNVDEIMLFAQRVEKERGTLPFEIDGIVIKLDDIKHRERLGTTAKTPRWAVAYKFAAQKAKTLIEDITTQVGRTGVLTPVAELKPVFVSGSTIARATLHNIDEIHRKDIRIGDTVWIEKGGDVIPKVVEVDYSERKEGAPAWSMPTLCPSCGSPVMQEEGEVAFRCINHQECPAQNLKKLIFFASKEAMDIENLGEKIVEKLAQAHLLQKFSDIYRLKKEVLLSIEGFKDKSAQNLIDSIEDSKKREFYRFILALGIKHVGKGIAELIANYCRSLDAFINLTEEELIALEGVGEKVAQSVVDYLDNPVHIDEINTLLQLGVTPTMPKQKHIKEHPFNGKTFVLTGSLEAFTRSQAAALIKERGGKVAGSVSAKTDYLLYGDDAGSKLKKAESLHISLMSEAEFKKHLAE